MKRPAPYFRARAPLRLSFCGGGTDVDSTKASDTIRASLESKREGFGTKVESVDCPSGVKVEAGTHFECTVRWPDGKRTTTRTNVKTYQGLQLSPP